MQTPGMIPFASVMTVTSGFIETSTTDSLCPASRLQLTLVGNPERYWITTTGQPFLTVKAQGKQSVDSSPVCIHEMHHSSARFFRMICRTSDMASCRMLSMGSSVFQNRTTLPSGSTRNFQKFHLGTFCTESKTNKQTNKKG